MCIRDRVNANPGNEYTIKLAEDVQTGGITISSSCKAIILGNGHTLTVEKMEVST